MMFMMMIKVDSFDNKDGFLLIYFSSNNYLFLEMTQNIYKRFQFITCIQNRPIDMEDDSEHNYQFKRQNYQFFKSIRKENRQLQFAASRMREEIESPPPSQLEGEQYKEKYIVIDPQDRASLQEIFSFNLDEIMIDQIIQDIQPTQLYIKNLFGIVSLNRLFKKHLQDKSYNQEEFIQWLSNRRLLTAIVQMAKRDSRPQLKYESINAIYYISAGNDHLCECLVNAGAHLALQDKLERQEMLLPVLHTIGNLAISQEIATAWINQNPYILQKLMSVVDKIDVEKDGRIAQAVVFAVICWISGKPPYLKRIFQEGQEFLCRAFRENYWNYDHKSCRRLLSCLRSFQDDKDLQIYRKNNLILSLIQFSCSVLERESFDMHQSLEVALNILISMTFFFQYIEEMMKSGILVLCDLTLKKFIEGKITNSNIVSKSLQILFNISNTKEQCEQVIFFDDLLSRAAYILKHEKKGNIKVECCHIFHKLAGRAEQSVVQRLLHSLKVVEIISEDLCDCEQFNCIQIALVALLRIFQIGERNKIDQNLFIQEFMSVEGIDRRLDELQDSTSGKLRLLSGQIRRNIRNQVNAWQGEGQFVI